MKKTKVECIFQVGMVVNDIDEKIKNWKEIFEIDESTITYKCTKDLAGSGLFTNNYMGKPAEFWIRIAKFNLCDLEFELIEPLEKKGGDPFSDFLINSGEGIHHINIKLEDREGFIQTMEEKGIVPMTNGEIQGKLYAMYNLNKQLGILLECGSVVGGPKAKEYYKKDGSQA